MEVYTPTRCIAISAMLILSTNVQTAGTIHHPVAQLDVMPVSLYELRLSLDSITAIVNLYK